MVAVATIRAAFALTWRTNPFLACRPQPRAGRLTAEEEKPDMSVRDTDVEEAWNGVPRGARLAPEPAAARRRCSAWARSQRRPCSVARRPSRPTRCRRAARRISLADLISKAQKEGTINTITLPPTWANYGEIMKTYQSKFKMKLTDAIPDGTSAQENQAVVSQKGSKRAPDVLDVGPSFAEIGRKQGLYAHVQGLDLVDDPGQPQGRRAARGSATTGASSRSASTPTSRRPCRRAGPISRTPPTRT